MATDTFDRKLEITDPESVEKLVKVMMSDPPTQHHPIKPYTYEEMKRTEKLLRQLYSRSGN